jgi:hypothetical protein
MRRLFPLGAGLLHEMPEHGVDARLIALAETLEVQSV